MTERRNLLALIGTAVLLLSLSVPLMQCAPAVEEEVTPPPEEEGIKYGGRLTVGWLSGGQAMEEQQVIDGRMMYTT